MIKKLDSGATLITLGEGTVFSGIAKSGDGKSSFGIGFSNTNGENVPNDENLVIMQITNGAAVASYVMALVRLMESWDTAESPEFAKELKDLSEVLIPLLPIEKKKA